MLMTCGSIEIIRFDLSGNAVSMINTDKYRSTADQICDIETNADQLIIDTHSEKFEINEEVDSLLSEKVSNFLLTWKVNSITVDNKSGGLSLRR